MKVTLEKLPTSQVSFDIQVEGAKSQAIYDRLVKDLTRTIQVPGFRKGKAPKQLVLRQVGTERLKLNVLEELIEKTLNEALETNKDIKEKSVGGFELITNVEELVKDFTPGQEISFKAAIDIEPEVAELNYKGLTVQAEEIKPDLTEVDRTFRSLQIRKSTLVPAENRPIQTDDVVTIDLQVINLENGEPIEDAGEQDFQIDVDENAFIPEVVKAIIGAEIDQVIEVESTFPQDYYPEEYVGKPIKYVITIKTIKGRELPDLDDEFAQSISDKQTIAELREVLEQRAISDAEAKTKSNKENAVLDALTKDLEVELPKTLIRQELDFLVKQQASYLQEQIDPSMLKQLFTKELIEEMRRLNYPEAIKRIRRKVALDKVIAEENLIADPSEIQDRVNGALEYLKGQSIDRSRLVDLITDEILTEKALQWLVDNSEIELVPQGSLKKSTEESGDLEVEVLTEDAASTSTVTVEATAAED
ncbi:MAG: trigger factor [Pseudanabaenaceae cyanobacterium bins.39]|nr:trigger factor [Pseudanabaenaceae cyanobacterium bins.39]